MIMIENYLTESIWKYFMENEYVKKGMKILKIDERLESKSHMSEIKNRIQRV